MSVHSDKSNQRKGKVAPGWHKAGKSNSARKSARIARADRKNHAFWSKPIGEASGW